MATIDILAILQWWFMVFIGGIIVLPLVALIFPSFIDRGYAFAKIIGMILVSYIVFVFGTVKLAPFTPLTIYATAICVACISVVVATQTNAIKILNTRKRWSIFIFEELIFLCGLWFWSYIRSFNPDIYGLEKFMDFGFVNSILRTTYFPPKDMWFTPFPINYYYFGHLTTAVLTKASHIPSYITFNLMMATLFSLCFTQVFSLTATLWKQAFPHVSPDLASKKFPGIKSVISTGLLAALLVTLAGNLHILYAFFSPYANDKPQPLWELKFLPATFPNSYWYPNATRFIYNTIHEFPIYSWVVSDLHGHVLDIPIVLCTISLIYSFFIQYRMSQKNSIRIGFLVAIGFMMAIMYMTNAWDGLIYSMLAGLVILTLEWGRVKNLKEKTHHIANPFLAVISKHALHKTLEKYLKRNSLLDLASGIITSLGIIGVSFVIFSQPFSHFFEPAAIVKGIGVLCMPKAITDMQKFGPFLFEADHCQKSPWWQLLTLYGFFYIFVVCFVLYLRKKRTTNDSDVFITILITLSSILIIIPEFLYMKDIYPAHYRANTMFKLVFQSFMMLSIASGYIIMRTLHAMRKNAGDIGRIFLFTGYALFVTFLLSLVFTYPVLAIKSYYGEVFSSKDTFGNPIKPKGLDGIAYLKTRFPTDFAGIAWLNQEVSGQPVILEAQGDSYTDYGRVSANTGLPTILGWTVHEWLWRGSYDVPSPRITEVQTLYETADVSEAKKIITKYHVQYIFLGEMERQKYPNLSERKFSKLGKKVFAQGNTRIYKITF